MFVENYEAFVSLGCSKEEQSFFQPVHLSVKIIFVKKVLGEQTDQLHEAVDYVSICEKLNLAATGKSFHLIEHMAYECMQSVKPLLKNYSGTLKVSVKKIRVPVKQLQGGVRWTCQTQF